MILRQISGELGGTGWSSIGVYGLKFWTPLGKKVLSSLRVCSSKFSGSVGDWEFGNIVLMGILKLNSAGDMFFRALALVRISPGIA